MSQTRRAGEGFGSRLRKTRETVRAEQETPREGRGAELSHAHESQ